MDISKLKKGMIFKNYKELCSFLEEIPKGGDSKKAQLKEWAKYFEFHKEGNSFIIDKKYRTPKEKKANDKRAITSAENGKKNTGTGIINLMERIILSQADYIIERTEKGYYDKDKEEYYGGKEFELGYLHFGATMNRFKLLPQRYKITDSIKTSQKELEKIYTINKYGDFINFEEAQVALGFDTNLLYNKAYQFLYRNYIKALTRLVDKGLIKGEFKTQLNFAGDNSICKSRVVNNDLCLDNAIKEVEHELGIEDGYGRYLYNFSFAEKFYSKLVDKLTGKTDFITAPSYFKPEDYKGLQNLSKVFIFTEKNDIIEEEKYITEKDIIKIKDIMFNSLKKSKNVQQLLTKNINEQVYPMFVRLKVLDKSSKYYEGIIVKHFNSICIPYIIDNYYNSIFSFITGETSITLTLKGIASWVDNEDVFSCFNVSQREMIKNIIFNLILYPVAKEEDKGVKDNDISRLSRVHEANLSNV